MAIPDFNGSRVLVTGGAGFIGSHLTDALVARGAAVVVLDNLSTGSVRNLEPVRDRIELHEADIRDAGACKAACDGVSYVFHQAALGSVPRSMEDPATSIAVNVSGTANVFAAARDGGARRVVYASSSSVYGDSTVLPKREGEEGNVLSPYAMSKVMNEGLADVFGRCFDMQFVGLRYFNIYGPRQDPNGPYAAVVPRFFDAAKRGKAPQIHGDGQQSRDFTYVADAVAANLHAAGAPPSSCGRAYNVGAGGNTTILELATRIGELLSLGVPPEHGPPRAGDVKHSNADVSATRELLGHAPSIEIARGLELSKDFYAPGAH